MQKRINNRVIVGMGIVALAIGLLIILIPVEIPNVYAKNYFVSSCCLIGSILLLLSLYIKGSLDILEPISFISLIYILIYFVTPIYDVIIGQYYWFGYDLFPYGVKPTLIAFAGFVSFFILYTTRFSNRSELNLQPKTLGERRHVVTNKVIPVSLLMYVICFLANTFYLVLRSGNRLLYLLTLGLAGEARVVDQIESPIGFVVMFSFCLPAITLLYIEYGHSRILKVTFFFLMLMLQIARGFRYFVIQIVVTFFAFFCLKSKRRPKIRTMILVLFLLLIPVILMTMYRNSIRMGLGMDLSVINLESIKDALNAAFWDNLRIYRNFYGMVRKVPSVYPYVYGRQMIIGTIIMMIPRLFWPGKPPSAAGVDLTFLVGARLKDTGQAYPNIGEYYYAMGIPGVIICMAVYGTWAKKTKRKLLANNNSPLDIIEYSILLGTNLQLIIRGYLPSNFWYIFFSLLPIIIVKLFCTER